jgi:hypothetical protein
MDDEIIEKLPLASDRYSEEEKRRRSTPSVVYSKCPEVSGQVRRLSAVALTKRQVAIACRLSEDQLNKHYLEEYLAGVAEMQQKVASAAMDQVENGNPAMIMYMAKSRLGWTENNVVEHVGEVKHVVSAEPMSREEFSRRYLEVEADDVQVQGTEETGKVSVLEVPSVRISDSEDDEE